MFDISIRVRSQAISKGASVVNHPVEGGWASGWSPLMTKNGKEDSKHKTIFFVYFHREEKKSVKLFSDCFMFCPIKHFLQFFFKYSRAHEKKFCSFIKKTKKNMFVEISFMISHLTIHCRDPTIAMCFFLMSARAHVKIIFGSWYTFFFDFRFLLSLSKHLIRERRALFICLRICFLQARRKRFKGSAGKIRGCF